MLRLCHSNGQIDAVRPCASHYSVSPLRPSQLSLRGDLVVISALSQTHRCHRCSSNTSSCSKRLQCPITGDGPSAHSFTVQRHHEIMAVLIGCDSHSNSHIAAAHHWRALSSLVLSVLYFIEHDRDAMHFARAVLSRSYSVSFGITIALDSHIAVFQNASHESQRPSPHSCF